MADSYYGLTISAQGASTEAYFSVNPTSNLQIAQGGVSMDPTGSSAVMVNIYPETLQIQAPAGTTNGAVTIITSAPSIDGDVQISPAIDVATVITLYGNGGTQLGQYILDPGTSSGAFKFPVPAGSGFPNLKDALSTITQKIKT